MPTPETLDTATADDAAIVNYMIDYFDHLRLASAQVDLLDHEDLYARCTDVLGKIKDII